MFVRKRVVDGRAYYQLLESYREGGRPRHRVIASWSGPWSLAEELRLAEGRLRHLEPLAERYARAQTDPALRGELIRRFHGQRRDPGIVRRRGEEHARGAAYWRAKVAGLRRAVEVLGDWRDPDAGKPADPVAEAA